jgi:hypothetical protein
LAAVILLVPEFAQVERYPIAIRQLELKALTRLAWQIAPVGIPFHLDTCIFKDFGGEICGEHGFGASSEARQGAQAIHGGFQDLWGYVGGVRAEGDPVLVRGNPRKAE